MEQLTQFVTVLLMFSHLFFMIRFTTEKAKMKRI
jgi:hypothetical protein